MTSRRPASPSRRLAAVLTMSLATVAGACSTGGADEPAVLRGDRAFGEGNLEEALAEYRLAARQSENREPAVLARVGHTYASMGRVDEAREAYEAAAALDSAYADQAVADMIHLARDAHARSDRFQMAAAVETALQFRSGLAVRELALPLARHYFQAGEFGRALPFYQKALLAATDSAPEIVMEIGTAHEEIGDCERALVFFERFREMVEPWERGEVDWHIGTCSFRVAETLRRAGDLEEAHRLVERTLTVGEPRNLQAQAWFEKGEILSRMGECDAAVDAYRQVRMADPSGSGALVRRAEERIDEVRFGSGLVGIRGRC